MNTTLLLVVVECLISKDNIKTFSWKLLRNFLLYILNFFFENQNKWKNAICVISQVKFISGLNLKFIPSGFFVAKNVGVLFQNKVIITMVAQESQNNKSFILEKKEF